MIPDLLEMAEDAALKTALWYLATYVLHRMLSDKCFSAPDCLLLRKERN